MIKAGSIDSGGRAAPTLPAILASGRLAPARCEPPQPEVSDGDPPRYLDRIGISIFATDKHR